MEDQEVLLCFLLDASNERLLGQRGSEAGRRRGLVNVGRRPQLPLLPGL